MRRMLAPALALAFLAYGSHNSPRLSGQDKSGGQVVEIDGLQSAPPADWKPMTVVFLIAGVILLMAVVRAALSFHATVLHLLGMDHTRLTYRHSGRDYRLTDVHGNVVSGLLDA